MVKKPAYEDDEISIGDRFIPKHVTTESLETLGATLNFIEILIKLLDNNYDTRRVAYSIAMKDLFKQIPTTMTKLGGLAQFLEKFKNQPKITKLGIIVELDV